VRDLQSTEYNLQFFLEIFLMFHTYPEAEVTLPAAVGSGGERLWHWVELGLNSPYFLLEVLTETEEGPLVRHVFTADVRMVLHTTNTPNENVRLLSASVLSPGSVNGTDGYTLSRLSELWSADEDSFLDLLFVLEDGSAQRFTEQDTPANIETMKRLADFPRAHPEKTGDGEP
jgi:hypothetical protein